MIFSLAIAWGAIAANTCTSSATKALGAISERVRQVVCEHLGVECKSVTTSSTLAADLGADELDVVELVMACEEEFEIEIPDEEVTVWKNVADIVSSVKKHQKK